MDRQGVHRGLDDQLEVCRDDPHEGRRLLLRHYRLLRGGRLLQVLRRRTLDNRLFDGKLSKLILSGPRAHVTNKIQSSLATLC